MYIVHVSNYRDDRNIVRSCIRSLLIDVLTTNHDYNRNYLYHPADVPKLEMSTSHHLLRQCKICSFHQNV